MSDEQRRRIENAKDILNRVLAFQYGLVSQEQKLREARSDLLEVLRQG